MCPERRWRLMLASKAPRMRAKDAGGWIDGSRGPKKKVGTLCLLGTPHRRLRMWERKKYDGSRSDPPAERSLLHSSRRANATAGPGPQPGR